MIRRNDSFVPQFQLLTPHFLFLYIFFRQRRFIRNAKSDIDYDANVTEFTNLSEPILTASTIPTKTEIDSFILSSNLIISIEPFDLPLHVLVMYQRVAKMHRENR